MAFPSLLKSYAHPLHWLRSSGAQRLGLLLHSDQAENARPVSNPTLLHRDRISRSCPFQCALLSIAPSLNSLHLPGTAAQRRVKHVQLLSHPALPCSYIQGVARVTGCWAQA
eukprot:1158656-Pelagomonas_calceolata.AAC.13